MYTLSHFLRVLLTTIKYSDLAIEGSTVSNLSGTHYSDWLMSAAHIY